MKPYLKAIGATITLITVLTLQLCLFAYQQHSQLNLALIAYLYILLTSCSITMLACLALIMDVLTFLITGIFGLTILFLVPTSWAALKIKDDMYNKIAIPCCFIFAHAIFYNVLIAVALTNPLSFGQVFWATIQNCAGFLMLWWITKQPIHD